MNTAAPSYTIQIFRMGWYGGRRARRVWGPVRARGLRHPIPIPDPETGLVDCDWQSPVTLVVGRGDAGASWLGLNLKRVERIWRREGLKVPQKQPKRGRLWLRDGSHASPIPASSWRISVWFPPSTPAVPHAAKAASRKPGMARPDEC